MKRKGIILLVILIVFNLIITGFLLLDIQAFESPKTRVEVDIVEINSEELILETIMDIENPNGFDISIDDFELISKSDDGKEIGRIKIKGGNIKAGSSKIFSSKDSFILKSDKVKKLTNKISAKIGVKFLGFIQKSFPLEIEVYTSLERVMEQISQPGIEITTELTEIYRGGLNFSTKVDLNNPTNFLYDLEKIVLKFEKEDGTNVGHIEVLGDIIEPNCDISLYTNGTLFFEALDAKTLWMKLLGVAGIKIAGVYKKINLTADASIIIPDIKYFIFGDEPIDFQIPVQFKLTLKGILSNVGFKMYNPSNFSLIGKDLICSLYRLDGEEKSLLGQKTMEVCTIDPRGIICVRTNITIPYLKFLTAGKGKILPDWIILRIEGEFYIAGTRQSVPISLNAYVDPNVISQNGLV